MHLRSPARLFVLRLVVGLTAGFAVGAPLHAAAAVKVVATEPRMDPAPPQELLGRFHDALVKGLSKGGDILPAADVKARIAGDPALSACTGDKCAKGVAALFKVDRVVSTQIDAAGKTYTIHVMVFDANGTQLGSTVEEVCDICSFREVGEAVERAAEKAAPFLEAKTEAPAPVPVPVVVPPPAPAPVVVAPAPAPAPVVVVVAPPAAVVVAPAPVAAAPAKMSKDDDEPMKSEPAPVVAPPPAPAPAPAPAPVVVAVVTTPAPPAPAEEPPRSAESRPPFRPIAYALFAVAAASLVPTITFAYFASKENQPSCSAADPVHNCPQVFKGNVGPAAAFGVIAGAAAITGAVLLIVDHKRNPRPVSAIILPTRDGFAASASLSF